MSQKKTLLNLISTFTQNLQANAKMGLILSLLALYTLPSCEDPNRIGLDVQPEEDLINAIYVDNLPVKVHTIMRDSVYTYVAGNYLVGSYLDPELGRTTAETYGQMYTNSTGINFLENEQRVLDSIVMVLDYSYSYGDTSKIQTFKVYQLQDTLTAPLYSNSEHSVKAGANLLGQASFKPNPSGTSAVARIRLNDALGQLLLSQQNWTQTQISHNFPSWFVIKPDTVNNTCILGFDMSTSSTIKSEVKLYYTGIVSGNSTAKTASLYLAGANYYNRIYGNKSGKFFEHLTPTNPLSSVNTNNWGVVQSGTGIRTHLSFPFLDNIPQYFNGANKIKIVKAEVEIKSQTATGEVSVPSILYLSKADKNMMMPISRTSTSPFISSDVYMANSSGSIYTSYATTSGSDSLNNIYTYTLPLTWYFNNIIQNQDTNRGLILTSTSNKYSTSRLIFGDQNNTTNPLRLKLYYIKLD